MTTVQRHTRQTDGRHTMALGYSLIPKGRGLLRPI